MSLIEDGKLMIWTKYVGKRDMISVQLNNGKRLCFSKKDPIKLVPWEAFKTAIINGSSYVDDVIPYVKEDIKTQKQEVIIEPVEPEAPVNEPVEVPIKKRRGRKKKNG